MTAAELRNSAASDREPPAGLTDELRALWLTKAGRWDDAHNVAQDIHTRDGSWIHALLHLIEGDLGNSGYWYARAGRAPRGPGEIDAEWIASRFICAERDFRQRSTAFPQRRHSLPKR